MRTILERKKWVLTIIYSHFIDVMKAFSDKQREISGNKAK
ncbi:hypothetical protein KKH3_16560 [Pectobacterium actinidiae]|nr:hypothetical protein KKH3_16560 [Pectobacterium actinidiae]